MWENERDGRLCVYVRLYVCIRVCECECIKRGWRGEKEKKKTLEDECRERSGNNACRCARACDARDECAHLTFNSACKCWTLLMRVRLWATMWSRRDDSRWQTSCNSAFGVFGDGREFQEPRAREQFNRKSRSPPTIYAAVLLAYAHTHSTSACCLWKNSLFNSYRGGIRWYSTVRNSLKHRGSTSSQASVRNWRAEGSR